MTILVEFPSPPSLSCSFKSAKTMSIIHELVQAQAKHAKPVTLMLLAVSIILSSFLWTERVFEF